MCVEKRMSGGTDALLEEYKGLRQEIAGGFARVPTVLLANFTVTAGLISYGFSGSNGLIFLAPFIFIIPSMFYIASEERSAARIAAYSMVFHEGVLPHIKWETRLQDCRKEGPHWRSHTWVVRLLYVMLSMACGVLYYFNRPSGISDRINVLLAVMLYGFVGWGLVRLNNSFSVKTIKAFKDYWKGVKWSEDPPKAKQESMLKEKI